MPELFPVVTICGSMRFHRLMLDAARDLSLRGYIVIMPHCVYPDKKSDKEMLDRMHFAKIDMSDAICVVSDESGYVGQSTRREMRHAQDVGILTLHWWKDKIPYPEMVLEMRNAKA